MSDVDTSKTESGKIMSDAAKTKTKKPVVAKKAVKKVAKKAVKKVAKKAVKKVAAKKAPAANGEKKLTIGAYAAELLANEADVNVVLAAVLKKFPKAQTTKSSIYWYRSQMNK